MYKNKIKQYRKEKQMTMKELAIKTNISEGYICHLEKGTRRNPSTKVMEKIAKVLNKKITEVFFQE